MSTQDQFPRVPTPRRGRSSGGWMFSRDAPGPPICTEVEYSLVDCLMHQNVITMYKEDNDPIYRGDVRPEELCAGQGLGRPHPDNDSGDLSDSGSVHMGVTGEHLSSPFTPLLPVRAASPATPVLAASVPDRARAPHFRDLAIRPHLTAARAGSPILLRPAPAADKPRAASPSLSEVPTERARSPRPSSARESSLFLGLALRPCITTYLKRDKARINAERAAKAKKETAAKRQLATGSKARAASEESDAKASVPSVPSRHSRRLRQGRVGDSSDHGVWQLEKLVRTGYVVHVHDWNDERPQPMLDRHDYVMAVLADAPKGQSEWWGSIAKQTTKDLARLHRNSDFTRFGELESRVTFGTGFGLSYAVPHELHNCTATTGTSLVEIQFIKGSFAFNAISAYQNHLFEQFFLALHADVASKVSELIERNIVAPPFENSIFTTAEIHFCDAPSLSGKSEDSVFYTVEAFTTDLKVLPLPPGTTVLFTAGCKRYSFVAVAPHKTRYLVRQSCNAGALRWVDKGFRSDATFERTATVLEQAAWQSKRETRGCTSTKLFSKVRDVYVF
ncbi:hypothetical protein C8R44DRAFT_867519 [Mycena epipterygia]|nr:hypothetical protein C8R44DRAFT_867519 [Mycena epipterygia]